MTITIASYNFKLKLFLGSHKRVRSASIRDSNSVATDKVVVSYRLGSVSQDTQLCLWDITEDVLRQSYGPPHHRVRLSTLDPQQHGSAPVQKDNKEYSLLNGDLSGSGDNVKNMKPSSSSSIAKDVTDSCSLSGSNNINNNNNSNNKLTNSKLINCTSDISADSSNTNKNTIVNSLNAKAGSGGSGGGAGFAKSSNLPLSLSTSITATASASVNSSNSNLSNNNINNKNATEISVTNSNHINNNHSHHHHHHHSSAFNTLTQRFTNFSFGTDKSSKSNKRSFTLTSKSSNNNNNNNSVQQQSNNNDGSTTSTLRNKSTGSIVTSYDPMKLIGTPACPRFDECPVLEPLVCKKIAHERLTALIFREDCFLTACQDGFIYTWARPVS